jgi:hypothetical protein
MLLETGPPVVFFREQPEQVSPYHIHTLKGVILTENPSRRSASETRY